AKHNARSCIKVKLCYRHSETRSGRQCIVATKYLPTRIGSTSNNRRYHSGSLPSRYCKLAIGLVVAIFMIIIFVRLGRLSVADDPALDPMSNPNIKVNE
ncbi:hypothetical protein J6590_072501, partial [Homalodisca vitripennis]